MEYITDGELQWESIWRILADINDGYLSNIDGIAYRHDTNVGPFKLRTGDDDDDRDRLGSRLLKSISTLCGIASDAKHGRESEETAVYRASKFAPIVSKLSDQYAMEDQMYSKQFHDDVLRICDAIMEARRAAGEQEAGD